MTFPEYSMPSFSITRSEAALGGSVLAITRSKPTSSRAYRAHAHAASVAMPLPHAGSLS